MVASVNSALQRWNSSFRGVQPAFAYPLSYPGNLLHDRRVHGTRVELNAPSKRNGKASLFAAVMGFAFVAYFVVFEVTNRGGLLHSAFSAMTSVATLLPLAGAVRFVLIRGVIARSAPRQIVIHVALATAFTVLWYWLLIVAIGLEAGESITHFRVMPFVSREAMAWQLLQGFVVYGLLAAVTQIEASPAREPMVPALPPEPASSREAKGPPRYFINRGDDICPLDIELIIRIAGADDYSEVVTTEGRHLVRARLAAFEASLGSDKFLRVHRSQIVNVDRIVRVEPAGGGRMLLHMENGETVQSSRGGAKLLRTMLI
jgi:two-component system LytT family response regulator